ncbi:MAG: DUF3990 domain-containing protein [Bacteroidales bacterium]|nr:DUF3990 domain-containing protein [Bacteroidales bacterium]
MIVSHPDTQHSRKYLDFGRGFYLTSIDEQAVRYAQRFKRRGQSAWLNVYEFSYSEEQWNIKYFEAYDKEWLDFVAQCREGNEFGDFDLVIGGIANDKVIITLDRYFNGEISQEVALGLLMFEKPNIQYCIRSEHMLQECLVYIESKQL